MGKSIAEETFVYGRGRNLHTALPGRGETARLSSEVGPSAVLSSITTVWDSFLQGMAGKIFRGAEPHMLTGRVGV